jgi:hypothetical protein
MDKRIIYLTVLIFSALVIGCSSDPELFPNEISGIQLKRKISGDEAKQFVNKLHISSVTSEKNEITFYESNKGNATIYVTFYSNELDANQNFTKMTKKISTQNSVFIRGSFLDMKSKRIYRTYGMGQTHYVFVHDKLLFWISVETTLAKKVLETYLHHLK